ITFAPLPQVHDVLTSAGADPSNDSGRLIELLGARHAREAVGTAAMAMSRGLESQDVNFRAIAGRVLARAAWLTGNPGFELSPVDTEFEEALKELQGAHGPVLDRLRQMVATTLGGLAGTVIGPKTYFHTEG